MELLAPKSMLLPAVLVILNHGSCPQEITVSLTSVIARCECPEALWLAPLVEITALLLAPGLTDIQGHRNAREFWFPANLRTVLSVI